MRKKIGILILSVVALLTLGSLAYAQIALTKHNLAKSGTGTGSVKGDYEEICIYCHTPHGGSADAPLWNRLDQTVVAGATYTLYDSSTFDATVEASAPTGISKACLSCHDGTLGVNQLVNLAGSGFGTPPANTGDTKITAATGAPYLSTDLSDDHPVSMEYLTAKSPGFGTAIVGDNSFASGFRPIGGTAPKTFVDGATGTNPTGFELPLFGSNSVVQCASCHDPHNDTSSTAVGSESVAFLRVANTDSQLCRTCHLK